MNAPTEVSAILKEMQQLAQQEKDQYCSNHGQLSEEDIWKDDPADLMERFAVTEEYTSKIGKEEFLYPNLIINNHVVTIIAMSGGGKTTFMFSEVAPAMARKGLTVWYLDADSPASDHKRMLETANKNNFKFLNPDAKPGASIKKLIETLNEIAKSNEELKGWVIIFDTLKKFNSMMSKDGTKSNFVLYRKLANMGATVVLLGHANKYRDANGHLIFEGTGDVRSDSDELIYLESTPNATGGIDVTTVIDPDKGAKVRGLFKPFSFHISPERDVTLYDSPLAVIDHTARSTPKATDGEILDEATKWLKERAEPVSQKELVQHVVDITSESPKRVRKLIVQNSEKKDSPDKKGRRFVYSKGDRNSLCYEIYPVKPEQPELWQRSHGDNDPTF